MKLYEYPELIDEILSRVEESGGELTLDLTAELDGALGGLHEKVRSVQGAIRHFQAMETAVGDEMARLRAVQRGFKSKVDYLKDYLLASMGHEAVDRVVTEIGGVSRCQNSQPTIQWVMSFDPPKEFIRTKVTTEINHEAVQEANRHGLLPDGFTIEDGYHLRFK